MTLNLPRVALIITGGTIDSLGTDRLDLAWYFEAGKRLGPGELLAQIPEVQSIAKVEEVPFRRLPSHALVDKDWLDLVRTIHSTLDASKADGVVITHGTNTIEETAYFLTLALKIEKPVVLVGAMRPASAIGTDAYLNLLRAIQVAADPASHGRGALVVMNDKIFAGRDVTKTATFRVEAVQGRDIGPLGFADADGKIVYYHQTTRKHTVQTEFDVRDLKLLPRVDVVVSYVGADGTMVDAAVAAGAQGIVSAGTGAGRATPAECESLVRAHEKGVVICQSTRIGAGRVVRSPGMAKCGFVAAGNLPPWKARILLALALTVTKNPEQIQRMFDTY